MLEDSFDMFPNGLFGYAESAEFGDVSRKTEDGIPIRKLYITNLPPRTSRYELMECFRQYGWIKSCWVKMEDKDKRYVSVNSSIYAFITFVKAEDAHKALTAPIYEKMIRGRIIRALPADSWHQPTVDVNGEVIWHKKHRPPHGYGQPSTSVAGFPREVGYELSVQKECSVDLATVLNRDCLIHLFSYIPLYELIRLQRVNKSWLYVIKDYLLSIRTLKTSSWKDANISLTTAVLRHILQCLPFLTRLHIDHAYHTLNDRTAHIIGKFCHNLEEVNISQLCSKKWSPLVYGCPKLKDITFRGCPKITDRTLMPLITNPDSNLESLTLIGNAHVSGLFIQNLEGFKTKLKKLQFQTCYSLQGKILTAGMHLLKDLTTLRLDDCTSSIYYVAPMLLKHLPKLEELSLRKYTDHFSVGDDDSYLMSSELTLKDALEYIPELKVLDVSHNCYIDNDFLKALAAKCKKLISLSIASCNGFKLRNGVTDEGLLAAIKGCRDLQSLDVSHLMKVTDKGLSRMIICHELRTLTAMSSDHYSSEPFCKILRECHQLQEIALCGCSLVMPEIVNVAIEVLNDNPERNIHLKLFCTGVAKRMIWRYEIHNITIAVPSTEPYLKETLPNHPRLVLNFSESDGFPHFRSDVSDSMADSESDVSDDLYFDGEDNFLLDHDIDGLAIADLGYQMDEDYYEDYLYALNPLEMFHDRLFFI